MNQNIKKITLNTLKNGEFIKVVNSIFSEPNSTLKDGNDILSKIINLQEESGSKDYYKKGLNNEPFWNVSNMNFKEGQTKKLLIHMIIDNINLITHNNRYNNSSILKKELTELNKIIKQQPELIEYTNDLIKLNLIDKEEILQKYLKNSIENIKLERDIEAFNSFKTMEGFKDNLNQSKNILVLGLSKEENLEAFTKMNSVINSFISDPNKYYSGTKINDRINLVVDFIKNMVEENNDLLSYSNLKKMNFSNKQNKEEFLLALKDKGCIASIKSNDKERENAELKEIRDKYTLELMEKIKSNLNNTSNLSKEDLNIEKQNLKNEVEQLNFKFASSLSDKIIKSKIELNKELGEIVGEPMINSINKIKEIAKEQNIDLEGIDVSEQAKILYLAKQPGRVTAEEASFAAKVLINQRIHLTNLKKNNEPDIE